MEVLLLMHLSKNIFVKSTFIIIVTICVVISLLNGCTRSPISVVVFPSSDTKILLPDVKNGAQGKGFTCTGLAYDKLENIFWVGNYGKMLPTDSTTHNSVVALTFDGSSILNEINLSNTPFSATDIQGIAFDYRSNSLWIASSIGNLIGNISKNGVVLKTIDFQKPNGIVFDHRTNTLWVLTYSSDCVDFYNINTSGIVLDKFSFSGISDSDQLYLDDENNCLYFSAGANYAGENFIYKINLDSKKITDKYVFMDSYAIEGISINNNHLYIMNDGYFHSAKDRSNYMAIYNLDFLSP